MNATLSISASSRKKKRRPPARRSQRRRNCASTLIMGITGRAMGAGHTASGGSVADETGSGTSTAGCAGCGVLLELTSRSRCSRSIPLPFPLPHPAAPPCRGQIVELVVSLGHALRREPRRPSRTLHCHARACLVVLQQRAD